MAKKKITPIAKIRQLKIPSYKSFRLEKRVKKVYKKLPSAFKIFKESIIILAKNWPVFVSITVVYVILGLVLVHGVSAQVNVGSLKDTLKLIFNSSGGFSSSSTLFSYLVGHGGGPATPGGGVYQLFLIITVSLASIWALRQILAKVKIKLRDPFYKGMAPLIPFLLVLIVIALQLIPLLFGGWLYGTITANGIAVTLLEKIVWALFCGLLATFSLYMICSSIFALYIVTLPNMTPFKALRSARELVRHRRLEIILKILFLPLVLLAIAIIIFVPLISWAAGSVEWVFFAASAFVPVILHSYLYNLYRKLL